jgi:hypothetical protein
VDTLRMRGHQLDIERQLSNFRNHELAKFYPSVVGMDVLPRTFTVKELPKIVSFDDILSCLHCNSHIIIYVALIHSVL